MRTTLVLLLAASLASAQSGTVYPVPASQPNTSGATMTVGGMIGMGGFGPVYSGTGPGSLSATVISELFIGGIPPQGGPSNALNLAVSGAANAPFSLLASVSSSNNWCIVPSTTPCPQGPWMPSALPTPFGIYHVGVPFVAVLDGIGIAGGPPSALDAQGNFSLSALVPWSSTGAYNAASDWSTQALVVDPTAPAGFTLSAAFSDARWVLNCLLCPTPPPGG